MAVQDAVEGEDGSVRTYWPDTYQMAHEWDATSGIHRWWNVSGTLLGEQPYVQADLDAWVASRTAALQNADTVERQVESALEQDLLDLQTLLDTPNATINAGPAPYIKAMARVLRHIVRMILRRFDAVG